jgi:TrmH family RNA methyltransferase
MIHVILLEPVIPGNIGAVARVMKNFGFGKLVLINPHCDHLCDEARNRAKHSQEVLENAEVIDFFVVDDYDYLIATTAKVGTDYNISRSPLSPSELAQKLKSISPEKKIGLVIGREGKGMFNEEIERCDFVVTVPSSTEYPTLNISHAVAVLLYELYTAFSEQTSTSHITPIGKPEKNQIMRMFDDVFDGMRWETKEKKETQQKLWKKIVGKSMLTKREAYGVMGFLRKVMQQQKPVRVKAKAGKRKSPAKKKSQKEIIKKRASPKKVTSRGRAKAERAGRAKQGKRRAAKAKGAGKRKATKKTGAAKAGTKKRQARRGAKR